MKNRQNPSEILARSSNSRKDPCVRSHLQVLGPCLDSAILGSNSEIHVMTYFKRGDPDHLSDIIQPRVFRGSYIYSIREASHGIVQVSALAVIPVARYSLLELGHIRTNARTIPHSTKESYPDRRAISAEKRAVHLVLRLLLVKEQ